LNISCESFVFYAIRISAHEGTLENYLFQKHDKIEKYHQENEKVGAYRGCGGEEKVGAYSRCGGDEKVGAYIRCGGDEKCIKNFTRKRKI
jgi:hypothetical protein